MTKKSKNKKTENPAPKTPESLERRSFLKLLLSGLSAVAMLEVGGVSLFYLRSQNSGDRQGGIIKAGLLEDFPVNSVTKFIEDGFYLIRDENGAFLAVYQKCPHLGCNVEWQPDTDQFVCPCHASSFDKNGALTAPPVPRPLDIFTVKIEEGVVLVDTSKINTRERYDATQKVSVVGAVQN